MNARNLKHAAVYSSMELFTAAVKKIQYCSRQSERRVPTKPVMPVVTRGCRLCALASLEGYRIE